MRDYKIYRTLPFIKMHSQLQALKKLISRLVAINLAQHIHSRNSHSNFVMAAGSNYRCIPMELFQ